MAKIYYDKDANLNALKGKTVAIIGYGSQGGAQSRNLKDSGINVIVAEVEGTPNYERAKKDEMNPISTEEAAQKGDIIQILIPDEIQGPVYKKSIEKYMTKGKTLMFSHGFNIHFKQIVPPKDVDVIMVAPKGPGPLVRKTYEEGKGVDKSYEQAIEWYRNALEFENPDAMFNLGKMYADGKGVTKNYKQAIDLYQKAALLDQEDAIEMLKKLGVK